MAKDPPKYDSIVHSQQAGSSEEQMLSYAPKEEHIKLNTDHFPWIVPKRRKARGRKSEFYSDFDFECTEGVNYVDTGGKIITSNRFKVLQDLCELQDLEKTEDMEEKEEKKKEDLCLVMEKKYRYSSFDEYMSNNKLSFKFCSNLFIHENMYILAGKVQEN